MSDKRKAIIRVSVEMPYRLRATDDVSQHEYFLNESSHCSDNIIQALCEQFDKQDPLHCFCDQVHATFVKWADDE